MFYVLGLGNPGEQYEKTRHNIGRDLLFEIAKRESFSDWRKDKGANALWSQGTLAGVETDFLLPETFMNQSGATVSFLCKKQGAVSDNIVVVYDDIDIPFGTFKISTGRGDGGHNGIKSIISALGSKDFVRVRVGVAKTSFWSKKPVRPNVGKALNAYVLGRFTSGEQKQLPALQDDIAAALRTIVGKGPAEAMNQYN